MSGKIEDPAVLLAAIRATGGLLSQRADPRTIDAARRTAEAAGRALLTYRTDHAGPGTGGLVTTSMVRDAVEATFYGHCSRCLRDAHRASRPTSGAAARRAPRRPTVPGAGLRTGG